MSDPGFIAGSVVQAEGNKKPRAVVGAGFFGSLQVVFYLPGHMPSARTSVGNEEYEYKRKKERAAKLQQARNRRETVGLDRAAVAVALRHATDRKAGRGGLSTKILQKNLAGAENGIWTPIRPNGFI